MNTRNRKGEYSWWKSVLVWKLTFTPWSVLGNKVKNTPIILSLNTHFSWHCLKNNIPPLLIPLKSHTLLRVLGLSIPTFRGGNNLYKGGQVPGSNFPGWGRTHTHYLSLDGYAEPASSLVSGHDYSLKLVYRWSFPLVYSCTLFTACPNESLVPWHFRLPSAETPE